MSDARPSRRCLSILQTFTISLLFMGVTAAAFAAQGGPSGTIELREGYVEGCGAIIYYEVIGKGRPLIVLHGGPGSSHDYFLPYLLPLARQRQLVFLDERGSGKSQRLTDVKQYTLDAMSCDIDALRRALRLGSTDVMGHSFGGILAQAYAIHYAPYVRHLILAGTGSSAARLNADFKLIKEALPPQLRTRIESMESQGILGPDGAQLPDYRKLADEAELPYNYVTRPPPWSTAGEDLGWDVLAEMWGGKSDFHIDGNLTGFDFVPGLRRLSIPTLIIAGDHDLPSATTLEETHAAVSGSQLEVLKHSGHMTFVDQNDAFMDVVTRFLDK